MNYCYCIGFMTIGLLLTSLPVFGLSKELSRITIGFGGDVMLGRLTNSAITKTSYGYPWGNVLPLLKENDLNIVNLETTLTTSNQRVPKVFNFKADPDKVQTLKAGFIDVVNVANNHILDFDVQGLQETIAILDKADIKHVGAGDTIDQARKPAIITKNNIRIGVLGYTDNEPSWKATQAKPGTNYIRVGDIEQIRKDIKNLKETVDIVVISIHWGPNMKESPSEDFKKFAHQIIDVGADIIHGHSAHIFQGVERYKNKLIMYDTGDLVDDYAVDPILRNDRSLLFRVTVTKEKDKTDITGFDFIPLLIENMQVNLAIGSEKETILDRISTLSSRLTQY